MLTSADGMDDVVRARIIIVRTPPMYCTPANYTVVDMDTGHRTGTDTKESCQSNHVGAVHQLGQPSCIAPSLESCING